MNAKERSVLLVLCVLQHFTESSNYQDSKDARNEQTATVLRNVTGTGFHRHFTCQVDLPPGIRTAGCYLAVQLEVPREMYFDIDQISMLNGDEHVTVYSQHPVSTELPVDAVEESALWMFAGIQAERFDVSLPIHMRYQPPCEQGHASVHSLPEPQRILVNCESNPTSLQSVSGAEILAGIDSCGPGIAQAQPSVQCPWREMSFTLPNSPQEWEGRVPCGTPHATLYITLTTVLFTLCCAGYILHVLLAVSKQQTINQEQTRAGIKTLTS